MRIGDEGIKFLIDRNQELKGIRALYEPLWEEIAEYIFPRRIGIGYKPIPGQKQTQKQFDSTAEFALNSLAAAMHGTLTPTSSPWASFKLRDDRLNNIKEVMDWLEICEERMDLARHQSNFGAEIHETYLDLPGFGQGCMFIEEKPILYKGFNGFQYRTIQNSEYCTAENAEGRVDTLFREFELSARSAIKKFGKENVGEKIIKESEKKPDTKFNFLHCTFPSEEKGEKSWVYYYILVEDKKLISEGGYYEFPFIVPRWSKSSGEDYGRGRGHIALPDVKTLNKAKEFGLKAWAKDLDPPTFERDGGVIGSLKLVPGGRNIARDKDSIWVLDHKIRYDVSQIKEDALRQSIRQIFYADQLQLPEKSDMREMEVAVRYELMQRLLGPSLGKLEGEGLNPLIEREFGIMFRARALPMSPPILAKMGIREIDIEYIGPLAKAQRASEMAAIQKLWALGGTVQPIYPAIFDNTDFDKGYRYAGEVLGAPSKIMRSEEEVKAIREQRAKDQAEEKQSQDLERAAAGVKDLSPIIKTLSEAASGKTPA